MNTKGQKASFLKKGNDDQPLFVNALTVVPGGVETTALQNKIVPENEISAFLCQSHKTFKE